MIRKIKQYAWGFMVGSIALLSVGCHNNDEIVVKDPNAVFDAKLRVKQDSAANPNVDVLVDANTASTIKAEVTFISTSKDMKRLYITQNIKGMGETPYKPSETVDLKADGAIDLTNKNANNFQFQFALPVPSGVGTGTVVYKFWTTTGNGDFRDISQRLAVGPGTITLKYGSASNPDAGTAAVKSFNNVKLFAPLADGSSKTFVSLLDGHTYNVSQGIEYVSRWDIGYLYSVNTTDHATLSAPYNYSSKYDVKAIDIPLKASTTNDELNKVYFKKSSKTSADFDAINSSADLNFVTVEQSEADLIVTDLKANDVVEFIDQYGKKGLIKIVQVSGTNGSDGFIIISIKVQP